MIQQLQGPLQSAVVLFSGGLDSTVLAAQYKEDKLDVHLLTIDYGQLNRRELVAASNIAKTMNLPHYIFSLDKLPLLLQGSDSALLDRGGDWQRKINSEDLSGYYVPARNAIFLSLAWAFGMTLVNCTKVGIGTHMGFHETFPDATDRFIQKQELALREAGRGFSEHMVIDAPYTHMEKMDIVEIGAEVCPGLLDITWSCFSPGTLHCGMCVTCQARKSAFSRAEVADRTHYANDEGVYRG